MILYRAGNLIATLIKCILITTTLIMFCSCQGKPKKKQAITDLTHLTPTSLFDIFSNVELIPLETKSGYLIGIIGKVIYYNGFYYIHDVKNQAIYCYDKDGRFSFIISSRGKGPGEYMNISDFTIDKKNKRIVLLDAPMQRIISFDLDGQHIEDWIINNERVMGYNQIFSLSDSVLLLTSITNEQLIFFNYLTNRVIHKEFLHEEFLQAFAPSFNVYQFNGCTFVLPALSQKVFNVSNIKPSPYFQWRFGKHDNSDRQVQNLIKELKRRNRPFNPFHYHHEAVGKGNILNQHIFKVFETSRFMIALVEFDNNWRHVLVDKITGENRVFNHFEEQISLAFVVSIQEDRVIAYESGIKDRIKALGTLEWKHRIVDSFNPGIFSSTDRKIIESHNPMTDNPFLVIYTFRD